MAFSISRLYGARILVISEEHHLPVLGAGEDEWRVDRGDGNLGEAQRPGNCANCRPSVRSQTRIVLSAPDETSRNPPPKNATPIECPMCPRRTFRISPRLMSQRFSAPSSVVAIARSDSTQTAANPTRFPSARRDFVHSPRARSQTRSVASLPLVNARFPSVERSTQSTLLSCAASTLRHPPRFKSHTRMVPSWLLEIARPFGATATEVTHEVWPVSVRRHSPVSTSQTLSVFRQSADMTRRPRSSSARSLNSSSSSPNIRTQADVSKSHKHIWRPAVRARRPPSRNATLCTYV